MSLTLAQTYNPDVTTVCIAPEYEPFAFVADDGTAKPSGSMTYQDITKIADHPIRVRGCGNEVDERPRFFFAHNEAPLLKGKRYGCLFGITGTDIATTGRVFNSFASHYRMSDCEAYSVEDEEFNHSTVLIVPLARPVTLTEWTAGQEILLDLFASMSLPIDRYRCLNPEQAIPTASFASRYEQARYARTGFRVDIVNR